MSSILSQDLTIQSIFFRIIMAALCGAVLGLEPFFRDKPAGMRTYILVCMGSAITVLIGLYASMVLHQSSDPLRVAAQVISGIGFLGGGTILLRGRTEVTGLTTAAGLWASASIGIAIGIGFYPAAFLGTVIVLITMIVLLNMERQISRHRVHFNVYLEVDEVSNISVILDNLRENYTVRSLDVTPPRSAYKHHAGVEATLRLEKNTNNMDVLKDLECLEHVVYVLKSI